MSCKYCRHESKAYQVFIDEGRRVHYDRVAEVIPYDNCGLSNARPVISWYVGPDEVDWADHLPRLCVNTYSIPIRYCPFCGRELPRAGIEVDA